MLSEIESVKYFYDNLSLYRYFIMIRISILKKRSR